MRKNWDVLRGDETEKQLLETRGHHVMRRLDENVSAICQ